MTKLINRILCHFCKHWFICPYCKRWRYRDTIGDEGTPYEERPIEPKQKFIRIITTYYPDDIVCYEEYKGKPYLSIEYQENGETFIGYGTYNPDVLSRYLRDYFLVER